MDLGAVRTFVAVVDTGQFQAAGDELAITQQAVSKRIANLEHELGVRLFVRSPRGVQLSVDGQAFLPHARELLRTAERARAAVAPATRALRVDVLSRRIAPAVVLQAFHQQHPELELDVVTLPDTDVDAALAAVSAQSIDITFRALAATGGAVPSGLQSAFVVSERHQLLVGPRHRLADRREILPDELAGERIWMPGMAPESEAGRYYRELAAAFGLSIDMAGPNFGTELLLDELAASAELTTLVGERTRYLWPAGHDLRRIPLVRPAPVFPLYVVWAEGNPHPGLTVLLDHLRAQSADNGSDDIWLPFWV